MSDVGSPMFDDPYSLIDWFLVLFVFFVIKSPRISQIFPTIYHYFALEGRACPHQQSQLCCVNNDADPLMGRAYFNVRATGWERLHPFPGKGEGPWVGVETLP